jgi:hypothetical protein
MNMKTTKSFLTALGLLASLSVGASAQVIINELRIDDAGADDNEYFELLGAPSTPLTGLTYLVIGDSPTGKIEEIEDLSAFSTNASGFFLGVHTNYANTCAGPAPDGVFTLAFENGDNVTHMIVTGFSGALNDVIDDDADGVPNVTLPWTSIVDSIALVEHPDGTQSSGEFVYDFGGASVGPDGAFVPAHAFRCGDWRIGGFGDCTNGTPGTANGCGDVTSFCVGNTATPELCPCDNGGGSGAGCDIAGPTDGALLAVSSFAPDGFGGGSADYTITGLRPTTTPAGVLIRSASRKRLTVFGDGLLCLDDPVTRIQAAIAIGGTASIAGQAHGAGAGGFSYQYWTRSNPAAFCTPDAFSISNGVQLDW